MILTRNRTMRKRQSFLLTILTPDDEQASFRGQIKVIANGKTSIFTSADELYRLISNELYEDQQEPSVLTRSQYNQPGRGQAEPLSFAKCWQTIPRNLDSSATFRGLHLKEPHQNWLGLSY
jgi:hypothetical protein